MFARMQKQQWQKQLHIVTHHLVVSILNRHQIVSHQKLLGSDFHSRIPFTKLSLQSTGLGNPHQDHEQFNDF